MSKTKILTAKDLLIKSVELVSMVPEGTPYNEKTLKEPPQYYRYKQIMALMEAFGLGKNFEGFLKAEFLDSREAKDYEKLFREIKWVYHRNENATKLIRESVERLKATYLATFKYRVTLHKILHYWRKTLICDPVYLYPIILTKSINKEMINQILVIDSFLVSIIDPYNQEITIDWAKKIFNYPDIDISQVDIDFY